MKETSLKSGVVRKQIRIGFYNSPINLIKNNNNFENSNPGVGGTSYIQVVLIKKLMEDKSFDCVFFFDPQTLAESLSIFDKDGGGIFVLVVKAPISIVSSNYPSTKIITWGHCEYDKKTLKAVEKMKPYLNVFLTPTARDRYINSTLYINSSIIGNFTQTHLSSISPRGNKHVSYIGALNGYKHCDLLTKAWPLVLKKIPDAKLSIIGSSRLYNKDSIVGVVGVAKPQYEKELLYPLIKHNCMNTVEFKGLMTGSDIFSFLKSVSVGVVNPIGSTETFCTSAIEFGTFGIPVIGGDWGGLRTTIPEKCGFLVRNHKQLAKKIIFLLNHEPIAQIYGNNYKRFVDSNYSLESFIENWKEVLINVDQGKTYYVQAKMTSKIYKTIVNLNDTIRLFIHRVLHYVWRLAYIKTKRWKNIIIQ